LQQRQVSNRICNVITFYVDQSGYAAGDVSIFSKLFKHM